MTAVERVSLPDVPGDPGSGLSVKLTDLRVAIALADGQRQTLAEAGDWVSLSWALSRLRAYKRDLATLEAAVTADVAGLLPSKRETVDGLGTLERRTSKVRKDWQSGDLLRAVVRKALDPDGTGEIPASVPDAVEAIVAALEATVPLGASTGWKVTGLRGLDLVPGDWCTEDVERVTVTIHGDTEADK